MSEFDIIYLAEKLGFELVSKIKQNFTTVLHFKDFVGTDLFVEESGLFKLEKDLGMNAKYVSFSDFSFEEYDKFCEKYERFQDSYFKIMSVVEE